MAGIPALAGVSLQRPEEQWVARCRAGDVEALGQLYAAYQPLLFRYAYRMLGSREDAQDIGQETFVRAYQAMGKFRGDCSLQTWLLRICANLCRSRLRSRSYQEVVCDPLEVEGSLVGARDPVDPAAEFERSELVATVRRALRSLPPAQRELIVLREYEELSCEQIGEILGCAPVTVRVKLFRARCRLKERVEALMKAR